MECLIGIVGKDFVLMASDTNQAHSIVVMKQDDDKLFKLSKTTGMLVCGEPGDRVQFAEYIQKNLQLYRMNNGYDLSTYASVNFTRRQLATSLRSQQPYHVNMLIGGYDNEDNGGPILYFMDYLASSVKLPFAIHGYGQYFGMSIFDRYYKKDLNEAQALELLQKVITEIQRRFLVNLPTFQVRIINKDGIKDLSYIYAKPITIDSIRPHESMDIH